MNALPTKTCVGCEAVFPRSVFVTATRCDSRCPDCRRRYWRNAHDRSRTRRGLNVGTLKPRVVDMTPSWPAPKPFFPPADFLPMGTVERDGVLRWSLGMEVRR